MQFHRRRFLLWSLSAGLLGQSRRLLAALVSPATQESKVLGDAQLNCLRALVDTLLPADEHSPGASEVGVAARVAKKARGNSQYRKLIRGGCGWLDGQARGRGQPAFADLDPPGRDAIVQLAEQAAVNSVPRVFFEQTRDDAFHFYYAQPETWVMLDYPGPPQPRGFMDYSRPPAK